MLSGAMLATVLTLTCSPPSSVQHLVAVHPAHTARPKCVDFSDVKACGGVLGTFNDLVGVAEFADVASLSCGLQPVVMGHAFGACSFVRPPEIDRAGFNGTGALDCIGSSLVFTFLEVWLGSSLVFMCLYWLWIKLRDTEQNTAKLLIAASQNAERYRQACATAALWRERAITAQDCAAAEAQRTFTLIADRECAERTAAAAEQRLAIERAGRARADAAAERAAVEASAATAELAAVKANAAAAERAAAKVRCEASVVLAFEPIERKRAVERAVAANDAAHQRSYSFCCEAIRSVQCKYHEELLAHMECMQSQFERQSDHRDWLAHESVSLPAGSAVDQLRARAAASKLCADQAAQNANRMAASAERATSMAKTIAMVVGLPGLDAAGVATAFQSAITDASYAAEHGAIDAEYAAAEAGVHAVEARAAADAERAAVEASAAAVEASAAVVERAAIEVSTDAAEPLTVASAADAKRAAVEASAAAVKRAAVEASAAAAERTIAIAAGRATAESREGKPPGLGFDITEMLVGVTPLSEIVRYTSPLAGPLPESLRGLADQDRLTDGTAAAGCATVGESAAAVECAAVEVSAAAAERTAVEVSATAAERDALEASTAAAAVERVASVRVCGQRASRRGARGGRRAVTRRRPVSCIPPKTQPCILDRHAWA